MLKAGQFIIGLILLLTLEIVRVFFIMPFPGSQEDNMIELAYFINNNVWYLRAVGWLIIIVPLLNYVWYGKVWKKVVVLLAVVGYGFIYYSTNFTFAAHKIFREPSVIFFSTYSPANVVTNDQQVIGVEINGKTKAYPVEIIGYHHLVNDTLDGRPLMITYCTVCRTGRVFSPIVQGKVERFRLIGMDQFNAMFEDVTTGSWWRQVNGEAVAGPLKGKMLAEISAVQLSLAAWRELYPDTEILQPDTLFNRSYKSLAKFDEGTVSSPLMKRDSLSWKEKSWIIGVQVGRLSRAYDWNDLIRLRVINDTLNKLPILIAVEADSATFHVWSRDSLTFEIKNDSVLTDLQTNSTWNWSGKSIAGPMAKKKLSTVQAYQEFWHSWRTFRQESSQFNR
jgi:hypothetical protein